MIQYNLSFLKPDIVGSSVLSMISNFGALVIQSSPGSMISCGLTQSLKDVSSMYSRLLQKNMSFQVNVQAKSDC